MNAADRLQLEKMIQANDVEDCTENIREKKHSDKIRTDVKKLLEIKEEYTELTKDNPEELENMMIAQPLSSFYSFGSILFGIQT